MAFTLKKTNHLLLYYQCFLAIIAVFIFFPELDNYLFNSGIIPSPKTLIMSFCVASIPLFISLVSEKVKHLPNSVIKWCSLYLVISVISYQFSVITEVVNQGLATRILSILFLLLMVVIFLGVPVVQTCARWALLLVTVMNVVSNFYELFNPLIFNGFNETGRPAGFYVDPNKSGCGLILGLIFSLGLLPHKYRLPFFLIVFFGAFITFSRGATICLIILLVLYFIKRVIPLYQLPYCILGLIIVALIWGNMGSFLIREGHDLGIINSNIEKRIEALTNFNDPVAREADDDSSRLDIATFAWETFLEKPLFGSGIAHVREWGKILPHNVYLTFMVEHGFLGVTLLPLLILSVTVNACREVKTLGLSFQIFILIWAIFSNTILEDRETLMMFALMAVMSKTSYLNQINQKRYKS